MNADRRAEAEKVLQILVKGRIVERDAVHNRLMARDPSIDRDHLRHLVLDSLEGPFSVVNTGKDSRSAKAWARCWLLSTLGRIADDDQAAAQYVRRATAAANEPNYWARYWALESLVVTKADDLPALARQILPNEGEPLVQNLAQAILARGGDSPALEAIREGVSDRHWATLRALRVVPIEEAVRPVCAIVTEPKFSDATYDSIVALGVIPADWSCAESAVTALIACIKECRRHPWWDSMRTKALHALSRLQSAEAEPIFISELSDSNPSIVYEAARALEKVAGVSRATARIVEAASQTGQEAIYQYANALRWMDRKEVVEELESLMLSGPPDQQNAARELLSEIGGRAAFEKLRARADTMRQHLETLEKTEQGIRELFDSSLLEARSGYRLSTVMDTIVFLLGIGLIVLSAVLVFQDKETLAGLTATGGALSVLYNLFLANPRRRVQESVEHLMALKVIFLGYLRQLHQADKAYVRRFLDDSPLQPSEVREYSAIVTETMRGAVAQIRRGSGKTGTEENEPSPDAVATVADQPEPVTDGPSG